MNGILAIMQLTWIEARRRRIVLAAVLCGLGFLVIFGLAVYFNSERAISMPLVQRRMVLQVLTLVGLYAVNFLVIALSVLLPVDTLSGEIDSGVIQTLASKPVRRSDIVLGKWLVFWLMLAAYILHSWRAASSPSCLASPDSGSRICYRRSLSCSSKRRYFFRSRWRAVSLQHHHQRHRRVLVLCARVHRRFDRADRHDGRQRHRALHRHGDQPRESVWLSPLLRPRLYVAR